MESFMKGMDTPNELNSGFHTWSQARELRASELAKFIEAANDLDLLEFYNVFMKTLIENKQEFICLLNEFEQSNIYIATNENQKIILVYKLVEDQLISRRLIDSTIC